MLLYGLSGAEKNTGGAIMRIVLIQQSGAQRRIAGAQMCIGGAVNAK